MVEQRPRALLQVIQHTHLLLAERVERRAVVLLRPPIELFLELARERHELDPDPVQQPAEVRLEPRRLGAARVLKPKQVLLLELGEPEPLRRPDVSVP